MNWAVINGEKEVGVTTHMMDADLDCGDIVLQRAVPVGDEDTATDLFHRTLDLFGPITIESLDLISCGGTSWQRQDRSKASFFHKRSVEDSRIDWAWPAQDIAKLVRAQSDPYPSAFTFHRGERIRVLAASVSKERYGGTPGRIFIREANGVVIVGPRPGRAHLPGSVL